MVMKNMDDISVSHSKTSLLQDDTRWIRLAIVLWIALAAAVCVKSIVQKGEHSVYPVYAWGSRHWWADQPLHASYPEVIRHLSLFTHLCRSVHAVFAAARLAGRGPVGHIEHCRDPFRPAPFGPRNPARRVAAAPRSLVSGTDGAGIDVGHLVRADQFAIAGDCNLRRSGHQI